jgi:hypothetical protein
MTRSVVRSFLGLTLILLAFSAQAQVSFLSCIDQTQSWSRPLSGTISAVTYIVSLPLAPAPPVNFIRPNPATLGWLIGAYKNLSVEILIGISATLAQQFQQVTNGDQLFAQDKKSHHELLLIEQSYCPLLINDAAFSPTGAPIWTH